MLTLRYAAHSDVGLLRTGNEDSAYAGPRLLVVADGMGGHVGGEVASSITVTTMASLEGEQPPRRGGDVLGALSAAVGEANEQLRAVVSADAALDGMGTTVTAVLQEGDRLGLAHIGDSRCYRLRDGALEQITRDHTLVQSLVDEGRLTPEQAEQHPQRSLLTRALDGRHDAEPDLIVVDLVAGDRYLLCSDGLSGVVTDETLRETLAEPSQPGEVCERLVRLALRAGGPDNITVIVADAMDSDSSGASGAASAPAQRFVVGAAAGGLGAAAAAAADGGPPTTPLPAVPAQPAAAPGDASTTDSGGGANGGAGADVAAGEDLAAGGASALPAGAGAGASPPSRYRRPVLLLAPLVVLAVLAAGAYPAYAWWQRQFFVGADASYVAIFQGLRPGLAGSWLSRLHERRDLPLAALPPYVRDQVSDTIAADGLDDAERIVNRLEVEAQACAAQSAAGAPSGTAPGAPPPGTAPGAPGGPASPSAGPWTGTGAPQSGAFPSPPPNAVAGGRLPGSTAVQGLWSLASVPPRPSSSARSSSLSSLSSPAPDAARQSEKAEESANSGAPEPDRTAKASKAAEPEAREQQAREPDASPGTASATARPRRQLPAPMPGSLSGQSPAQRPSPPPTPVGTPGGPGNAPGGAPSGAPGGAQSVPPAPGPATGLPPANCTEPPR